MTRESKHRDAVQSALTWLHAQLISGTIWPGDQLIVLEIAQALRMSPTPVREALARLIGRGLIVERWHLGYFAPLPSPQDLVQQHFLLDLHLAGARRRARRLGKATDGLPDVIETAPMLYRAMLAQAQDRTLFESGMRCLDGLAAAHLAEQSLFDNGALVAAGAAAFRQGDLREGGRIMQRLLRLQRARAVPVAQAILDLRRANIE